MRLTIEEHKEAIKRYGYIKPARGRGVGSCSQRYPGSARKCTRPKGHSGPHVAHGLLNRILAVWDSATGDRTSHAAAHQSRDTGRGVARRPKRPVGLRDGPSGGLPEVIRTLGARMIASADQIAFVLLFFVFVKFAIEVLLSLH